MSTIKKIKISNSTYDLGVNQSAIGWGGDSVASNVTPIGAAMSAMHSANRLAFLDPDAINVEYSNNAGSTWTSYGAANADKIKLVTFEDAASFNLGKSGEASTNNKLRITLTASTTSKMYFYTLAVKLLINVSTSGHGMNVLIERKNGASGASWDSIGTYDLAGWSGWNDIPLYTVIGGSSNQTSQPWQLRFTFNCTSVNSSYKNSLPTVLSLKLFGVTNWMGASTLASTGNLYSYDWQQNATFPAKVTATSFSGPLTGNATTASGIKDSANSSTITASYASAQLAYSDITHLACWNGYQLRAINKSEFAKANHTHSYLPLSGGTLTGNVTINAGKSIQLNTLKIPTSSGGSTYGVGSNGQVLKSNGTTVYWAEDNNTDSKTSSSNTTSKIYLVGATSQSSAGQTTYSNSSCYASGGYLYSNGKKVDMDNISGGVEWSTF